VSSSGTLPSSPWNLSGNLLETFGLYDFRITLEKRFSDVEYHLVNGFFVCPFMLQRMFRLVINWICTASWSFAAVRELYTEKPASDGIGNCTLMTTRALSSISDLSSSALFAKFLRVLAISW
jgi:hypothetical protein